MERKRFIVVGRHFAGLGARRKRNCRARRALRQAARFYCVAAKTIGRRCQAEFRVQTLAELTAAAGLDHPHELHAMHFCRRVSGREVLTFADPALRPAELLEGTGDPRFREAWKMSRSTSFHVEM
jgi:hypothetical protein